MAKNKRDKRFWLTHEPYSPEFAAAAFERFEAHQKRLKTSKLHHRIKRMWATVYMRSRDGNCDETEITTGGRNEETMFITSNRLGRIIRDHVTMVVQTKSLPEPMAANSDAESQDQVALAKGIIEHYKREADLEGIKAERALVAEICGVSYLHVPWDAQLGREVAVLDAEEPEPEQAVDADGDPMEEAAEPAATQVSEGESAPDEEADPTEGQSILYEGDFRFNVRTLYEIAFERSNTERKRPRWWISADPENRYDLLQQLKDEVPDEASRADREHAIMNAPAWSDRFNELGYDADDKDEFDDAIAVYSVYGEICRAVPSGRYARFIDKKTVLFDGPMIEPRAPIFRLSQGEVLFRDGEATTPNHDGLPLADALAAQMSTILSNNANHGMMRTMAARDSNLKQSEIDSGAAVINYDHVDKRGVPIPPPQPWAPGTDNPGLYNFYQLLCSDLDLVAGGSPVTRGDPNSTKGDSGSKVAALFAAAQNIGSSFVADVIRSEEELYTFLIASLKIHATSKRIVSIVGEHNTFQAREYTKDKLDKLIRVAVQQADAMRDTLQGRMAMVEMLQDKTPDQQRQIIAVMRTGIPDPIMDEMEPARLLIERENEDLRNPEAEVPVVMPNDNHADHWRSHMNQLATPDARRDPAIYHRVIKHAKDHEAALDPMSPQFAGLPALLLSGQKPLPTAQDGGAVPGNPAPPPPMNPHAPKPEQGNGGPPKPPGMQAQAGDAMAGGTRMPVNPVNGQRMSTPGTGQPSMPAPSPSGIVGG